LFNTTPATFQLKNAAFRSTKLLFDTILICLPGPSDLVSGETLGGQASLTRRRHQGFNGQKVSLNTYSSLERLDYSFYVYGIYMQSLTLFNGRIHEQAL